MSLTKFGKKLLCFLALVAFGFALVACGGNTTTQPSEAKKTAEEQVEEIYSKIIWDSSAMKDISSNITLVTKTMYENVTVSWTSSHPDVISTTGVVSRPVYEHEDAVSVNPNDPEEKDRHVAVKLTATIRGSYEEEGAAKEVLKHKEFNFTVLCLAEGLEITSIAEAKAAAFHYIYEEMGVEKKLVSNSDVIYNVGVYGKVTAKLNSEGSYQFMIHDGTEGIYVYSSQKDLQIGDTVLVFGGIYSYYGNLQIANSVTVSVVEREIEVPAHREISIDEWEKENADLETIGYFGGKLLKLYAKLEKVEANVAKDVYKLTDPFTGEVAWIYYKSYSVEQAEVLDSYDGKYVNITGVSYDRDSRLIKNHLMWDGGIEEAEAPTLSDEQKFAQVKAGLEALAGAYASGSKLELPTANAEYEATIAWNLPADAPYAEGAFTLVEVDTEFTATAAVTINGNTQNVEVKFTVNPIKTVSVAEAATLDVDSTVKLSGTIDVIFGSKGNYYLKDASGSLLVYVGTSNGIQVNGETITVKAGDQVTLIGKTASFNGTPQIGTIVSYESHAAGEWKQSVATGATVAEILAYTAENAPYGEYLQVSGTLVKSGNYYYFASGEQQVSLYNSNVPEELAALADTGEVVTLWFYFYGNSKSDWTQGDRRVIFAGREGEWVKGEVAPVDLWASEYPVINLADATSQAISGSTESVYVIGQISEVYNTSYGNMYLVDANGENKFTIYGSYDIYGNKYSAMVGAPVAGDIVVIQGALTTYNGSAQIKNGVIVQINGVKFEQADHEHTACPECGKCTDSKCDGTDEEKCQGHYSLETITIAEFLTKEDNASAWYQLTGVIANLANTTYGNFDLVDANDPTVKIYVYGLTATQVEKNDKSFASLGLKEGDTVTLIGTHASYNGAAQVGGPSYYVSHVACAHTHVACPTCTLCTDPNCDGTDAEKCQGHVVEGSSTYTWVKGSGTISEDSKTLTIDCGDFTITLFQNSSSSKPVNTYDQIRMYQDHILTITSKDGKAIKSVTFTDVNKKATTITLQEGSVELYTATLENNVVTISSETGASSVACVADKQIRFTEITVVLE